MIGPESFVLLHGTPLSPAVWTEVATLLAERGEDVLCPDATPGASAGDMQPEIAERILSELGPQEFHLVGHSFGGQIALEVALIAAERVLSLTLLCTRDTPFPSFAAAARALREGTPVDVDAAMRRWFRSDELAADGSAVRRARHCVATADPLQWAQALDAIAVYDRSSDVGGLDGAVTVIAGEHDSVSSPSAMSDLAARIPEAALEIVPEAAHMSLFTDPERLCEVILRGASRQ